MNTNMRKKKKNLLGNDSLEGGKKKKGIDSVKSYVFEKAVWIL